MKLALALAILALLAAAGCGSGSDSTSASRHERIYPNVTGPTRQFLIPDGDNVVQFYGREASTAERRQASDIIKAWLRARAKKDWSKDCSYFSDHYRGNIFKDAHAVSDGKVKSCAQALAFFGPEASGNFVDNLNGPIVSFRVRGGKGFAQYHGTDGQDWIVPMNKEEKRWRVSTAAPINRTK